ncbi:LysR family transcriptional regulator [Rhodobacteraceae bacterium CH30]|nr:LysR family transcriptional regulator [Rhodobacteraceae bacterium CH30]
MPWHAPLHNTHFLREHVTKINSLEVGVSSLLRLPPLNAVRAFEAAARQGSFVAAAAELHVTQPAIGRHIKLLEDRLGVRLFERTPRGVVLTRQGQCYYAAVSIALQQIARAGADLLPPSTERWLRLLVVPGFATRWLNRHLRELAVLRPGLRISVEPDATFSSIEPGRADLAIAFGGPHDFEGNVMTLARPRVFPVCSPAFLLEQASLLQPSDLLSQKLVHEDDGWWWTCWFAAFGVKAQLAPDISFLSADHAIDVALAGGGIALANEILVADELRSGRLQVAIADSVQLEGYQLLLPAGDPSDDVRWFCAWLREILQQDFPAACGQMV